MWSSTAGMLVDMGGAITAEVRRDPYFCERRSTGKDSAKALIVSSALSGEPRRMDPSLQGNLDGQCVMRRGRRAAAAGADKILK